MPDNVAAIKRETVQKNLPKEISDGFLRKCLQFYTKYKKREKK